MWKWNATAKVWYCFLSHCSLLLSPEKQESLVFSPTSWVPTLCYCNSVCAHSAIRLTASITLLWKGKTKGGRSQQSQGLPPTASAFREITYSRVLEINHDTPSCGPVCSLNFRNRPNGFSKCPPRSYCPAWLCGVHSPNPAVVRKLTFISR